jgi:hypothetical protein
MIYHVRIIARIRINGRRRISRDVKIALTPLAVAA